MRILVTGGLGAVGVPLSALLRERGHEVWVLDRGHHHGLDGRYYLRCDLGEYRQLAEVFRNHKFDLVYNAAAEFGRLNGEDFYETLWRTNAVGTKHVIRLQEEHGFKLVHFSSSEIYGDWREVMSEDVPDQHPVHQLNDYAITKWVNELQVRNSMATRGTESVVVRLFNTYGPGEPYSDYRSVICLFTYRALHGLPYRVYMDHHRTSTYIDDTVRTLANISERFRSGAVYNIAGETYHDIKTISDMILKEVGRDDRLVEYVTFEAHNIRDKKTDARRARAELDHRETVPIEEGIRRTVAWQRKTYAV
jgi:dTDP-glucose 4,6-dehydratase